MSSKDAYEKMSEKEKKELDELMKEMIEEAKKVRQDFKDNPSDENVSDISIDFDSPYLDEQFKDNQWKKIVKPQYMDTFKEWLKEKKKNDKKT